MARIREATPASPIAVFLGDAPGCINTVFAATARSQALINRKVTGLIGVFHQDDNPALVRAQLEAAVRGW